MSTLLLERDGVSWAHCSFGTVVAAAADGARALGLATADGHLIFRPLQRSSPVSSFSIILSQSSTDGIENIERLAQPWSVLALLPPSTGSEGSTSTAPPALVFAQAGSGKLLFAQLPGNYIDVSKPSETRSDVFLLGSHEGEACRRAASSSPCCQSGAPLLWRCP